MTKSNKEIALEVLKMAFIDRDPTVVEQYFGANYKQHNPVIPDGPSAIAEMIPTLTALTYEPGMAVADGDLVMVHGRYTGWGPKPMVAVDIFRIENGKVVEHWDVMQEEVSAIHLAATPCSQNPECLVSVRGFNSGWASHGIRTERYSLSAVRRGRR
jgi:predicted SnoaL-like aldol condensation-catalyzing enzyme